MSFERIEAVCEIRALKSARIPAPARLVLRHNSTSTPLLRNMSSNKIACAACSKEFDAADALYCAACNVGVHAACLGALLAGKNVCICGNRVSFSAAMSDEARKRSRMVSDMQVDPPDGNAVVATRATETVSLDSFFKRTSTSKKLDANEFFGCFQRWSVELDRRDKERVDEFRCFRNDLNRVADDVERETKRTDAIERTVERHDAKLSAFELIVDRIPGTRIPGIKDAFLNFCKFVGVSLRPVDIADVRSLRRDPPESKPQLNCAVFKLRNSAHVAEVLLARKGT